VYPAADGDVIIAANQDTVFARLCVAMGRPELATDPRFTDHRARGEHQAELDGIIGQWSATVSSGELLERLRAAAVPSGLLYSPADMMDDAHMRARGSLVEVPTEGYGPVTMQATFPVLSETPGSVRWGGRPLGADTDGVLRDVLGLSEDRVAALRDSGVI
jgi:formyl-CoA transferase